MFLLRSSVFCLAVVISMSLPARAVTCQVAVAHPPSLAEKAFLEADFTGAAKLYNEQLANLPGNPVLSAALARTLIRQQKPAEAIAMLEPVLTLHPHSAILETALAEAEYRGGTLWKVPAHSNAALADDPCYARAHLIAGRYLQLTSMYKAAKNQIETAHQLDPIDPDIRHDWIEMLPPDRKIAELKAYLAAVTGDSASEHREGQMYLDHLEKRRDEPHKACHLVSDANSTEIPFSYLMADGTHIRAFGLDVKLNNKTSRLEIDTGASGIYISRSVAEHAGLKPLSRTEAEGVGSHGPQSGYTAYADSIHIGSLEFRDCIVEVSDRKNVNESDGLIGMDVFSRFLVTLDYPMRKLMLSPLPPRPGEGGGSKPALQTGDAADEEGAAAVAATRASAPAPDGKTATALTQKTAADGERPTAAIRELHDSYVAPEMRDYIPVYRVGHELLLPVRLNQGPLKLFMLDTGAFATSISPDAARSVTKVHKENGLDIRGINGKVDQVFTGNRVDVQFANLRQQVDDILAIDTSGVSRNAGVEVSGFLGFTTLHMLSINIDYRDGLVKFSYERNRGFER